MDKKRRHKGRWPCDNRGRDWNCEVANQGMSRIAGNHQKHGIESPSDRPGRNQTYLYLDFILLAWIVRIKFWCFKPLSLWSFYTTSLGNCCNLFHSTPINVSWNNLPWCLAHSNHTIHVSFQIYWLRETDSLNPPFLIFKSKMKHVIRKEQWKFLS